MSTSDLAPHHREEPPRRVCELGGGRHIEGWVGPANCGILIRNPLPLNSKPISCTQAIYFGRVKFMAQISLILKRTLSLWFGLHPPNLQLKTWNLKMGWVFVAPMSQTGRQTESEGWKLELGQIWLEMWESNESKYFEIHWDFYSLTFWCPKAQRKRKTC